MKIEEILQSILDEGKKTEDLEGAYKEGKERLREAIGDDARLKDLDKAALRGILFQPFRSRRKSISALEKIAVLLKTILGNPIQTPERKNNTDIDEIPEIQKNHEMNPLIQRLQAIHTAVEFQAKKAEIIDSIQADPSLSRMDKIRIPDILTNGQGTWETRLETVGNLLLGGTGNFRVISYSPLGAANFLDGILSRHGFSPDRLWSAAELELSAEESEYIRCFPMHVNARALGNGNVIGAVALLAQSQHVSETDNGGQVWQTIIGMQWSQTARNNWFADATAQARHRTLVENSAEAYGMRKAPQGDGQFFLRTILLQFGLSKAQWKEALGSYMPPMPTGVAAGILCNPGDPQGRNSLSFARTWDGLRDYRPGRISRTDAERVMEDSPWIRDEWIPELLEAGQTRRIPGQQESDDDEVEEPNILGEATLVWVNGSPCYQWSINEGTLDSICPVECKQLEVTGPCGWIGRIGRKQNELGWLRITGLLLNNDLSFQIPATGLEESEIGFDLSNPNIGFQFSTTSRLLQEGDLVTRFGRDGQRHSSAWSKQLPQGEEFSLCVPFGAGITGASPTRTELQAMGMEMLYFQQGWGGSIQVSHEDEIVWDSSNLIAPSKQLPPDQREFSAYLVLDEINNTDAKGRLQISGVNPNDVRISADHRPFSALQGSGALHFGTNRRPLAELWSDSKVRVKIQAPDGRSHWVSKTWMVTMRNIQESTPLFLGRNLDGTVVILKSNMAGPSPVETMRQFRAMKIKMFANSPVSGATLLQNGFSMGNIVKATKQHKNGTNVPKCLGRKIPFYSETFDEKGDLITHGFLMGGVVERGIIEKVGGFKNDGSAFEIELTHQLEPSLVVQPNGKNHRILIMSHQGQDVGCRILTTVLEGAAAIGSDGGDWTKWRVTVGTSIGNILGVVVCYGDTLLGCWTQGGSGACQNILEANDLNENEVNLLADYLRWFHLPFFDANLRGSVCRYLANHAASVLFRWETGNELNWGGYSVSQAISEPGWDRVVLALVKETNHFLKDPINYAGLAKLITTKVNQSEDRVKMIHRMLSIAPGCVIELNTIAEQNKVTGWFAGIVGDDHSGISKFDARFSPAIKDRTKPICREWYWKYRNDPESCRREFILQYGNQDAMLKTLTGELEANCDPDWSELRHQYATHQEKKGSKLPLIDLWLNPYATVNTALDNGVHQTQGKPLDGHALRQLNYLMGFPAFSRLLARKILSPTLTIPGP